MPPTDALLEEVAAHLRAAASVLVCCHAQPDGDAIGALLGMSLVLERLPHRPQITRACVDPPPAALSFLSGVERIAVESPPGPWDVVLVLDASDADRVGRIFPQAAANAATVIVMDHHVTNTFFGALNYVDFQAAATSQIVLELLDKLEIPLTADVATCLLTGLVTDTLGLRTSNTDARVMAAALRLMQAGADISDIARRSLDDRPLAVMRLWGLALSKLTLEHHVLWTEVTAAMCAQAGVAGGETGHLVSHLITAVEARIAAVFSELEDGRIEVDLRARLGYDVASSAQSLGGGGHRQAAGCTIAGPLDRARAEVLPLLFTASRNDG